MHGPSKKKKKEKIRKKKEKKGGANSIDEAGPFSSYALIQDRPLGRGDG